MTKTNASIYQIKITLQDSKPPIWRRLLVSSDTTLNTLHQIIQNAMGWFNCHLHHFIVEGEYYSVPHPDDWHEVKPSHLVKLSQVAPAEKNKFTYEYDFGDGWLHTILVEKILPPDPSLELPVCIKGKRACPPEDVGGIWGYDTFLEILRDPKHPEHESYKEWIGGEFDPEAFDLAQINSHLKRTW